MAICGCGLPAGFCQPAVVGGFIYADLWGELSTHLALQVLFTQSSPVHEPLLQAFPFLSTLEEVTLHPLSQACMFIYSSHRKWAFPLSYGVFHPLPLLQAFLLLVAGQCCCSCWPACLFTAHVGSGSSSLSCGVLLPLPLLQAFLLLVAGCKPWLPPSPARPSLFIYSSVRDSPPPSLVLSAPHPLFYMSLFFLLLITQFLFFPQVGVGLFRGLC
jgi:hypothetical protein